MADLGRRYGLGETPLSPTSCFLLVQVGEASSQALVGIVVESIEPIRRADITRELARESGFETVKELLEIAQHGQGRKVFLIRFRYLPPGGW